MTAGLPTAGAKLARDLVEAWATGDFEPVAGRIGWYRDPLTDGLTGSELAAHAQVWREVLDPGDWKVLDVAEGSTSVALTWSVEVTHRGRVLDAPPTGRSVTLTGTDVLTTAGSGTRVVRHVDLGALAHALGHDVVLRPEDTDAQRFGSASRIPVESGAEVGALALTWLGVRAESESDDVDRLSVEVFRALRASKGFLGAVTVDIGDRKFTLSAFDSLDSVRSVQNRAHRRAVRKFFSGRLCSEAVVTTWAPATSAWFRRCAGCDDLIPADADACECGRPAARSTLL